MVQQRAARAVFARERFLAAQRRRVDDVERKRQMRQVMAELRKRAA
jgi:hypothetical protein